MYSMFLNAIQINLPSELFECLDLIDNSVSCDVHSYLLEVLTVNIIQ